MSNTGRSKRLASFNCDTQLWSKFMQKCRENGTTATDAIKAFIEHYLDGSLDELAVELGLLTKKGKEDWEQRIKRIVDEYLEQRLPTYLDRYDVSQAHSPKQTQSLRSSTTTRKEKEFWFIKERAKYLGIEISANQLIHVELFANEDYKQRHGTLPKRELFRGNQAFIYPQADVDILDKAIKKVAKV